MITREIFLSLARAFTSIYFSPYLISSFTYALLFYFSSFLPLPFDSFYPLFFFYSLLFYFRVKVWSQLGHPPPFGVRVDVSQGNSPPFSLAERNLQILSSLH